MLPMTTNKQPGPKIVARHSRTQRVKFSKHDISSPIGNTRLTMDQFVCRLQASINSSRQSKGLEIEQGQRQKSGLWNEVWVIWLFPDIVLMLFVTLWLCVVFVVVHQEDGTESEQSADGNSTLPRNYKHLAQPLNSLPHVITNAGYSPLKSHLNKSSNPLPTTSNDTKHGQKRNENEGYNNDHLAPVWFGPPLKAAKSNPELAGPIALKPCKQRDQGGYWMLLLQPNTRVLVKKHHWSDQMQLVRKTSSRITCLLTTEMAGPSRLLKWTLWMTLATPLWSWQTLNRCQCFEVSGVVFGCWILSVLLIKGKLIKQLL